MAQMTRAPARIIKLQLFNLTNALTKEDRRAYNVVEFRRENRPAICRAFSYSTKGFGCCAIRLEGRVSVRVT